MLKNNKFIMNYLPYIISLLSVGTLYFQITEDGIGMSLYYSFWNNMIMALAFVFLKRYPYLIFASVALTTTIYSVYETYLLIVGAMDYPWWEYRNFVGHYLCPLLVIFYCLKKKPNIKPSFRITILPMVIYMISLLFNLLFIKLVAPLTGDIYPYFFMEIKVYGYLPSMALIVILFVLLRVYFVIYRNKIFSRS